MLRCALAHSNGEFLHVYDEINVADTHNMNVILPKEKYLIKYFSHIKLLLPP